MYVHLDFITKMENVKQIVQMDINLILLIA